MLIGRYSTQEAELEKTTTELKKMVEEEKGEHDAAEKKYHAEKKDVQPPSGF